MSRSRSYRNTEHCKCRVGGDGAVCIIWTLSAVGYNIKSRFMIY